MISQFFVLSIIPFIVFLFLLLFKKLSLLLTALITLFFAAGIAIFFWQILPTFILVSFTKGFLVAFDIFLIIFGALFFLKVLEEIKIIGNIGSYLESLSSDLRVQVIFLAWFFENFLEGTAGFGTAGIVVAPLLVGLGLSPITAVVISLLGNSTSVAFGAAGTPIRIGFAGLNVSSVPLNTALINSIGFLVPVFILWFLVHDQKGKKADFLEMLPFAVWSGVAFVIPSILTVFLGQEFPSILGSLIGFFLVFLTTRLGIFLPKNSQSSRSSGPKSDLSLFKDFFPYVLLISLLVVGKFLFKSINPGLAFILAGLPTAILWGGNKLTITAASSSFKKSIEPFLIIFSMSVVVQLMTNSGNNLSGLPSSLEFMAKTFETRALPFLAPIAGAFGSFLTGSATVSNLMFGSFLSRAAGIVNFNQAKILSLELVGASAGNMIALSDILAAEVAVGLKGREREVIGKVAVPCLIYVLLVGLIGLLIT